LSRAAWDAIGVLFSLHAINNSGLQNRNSPAVKQLNFFVMVLFRIGFLSRVEQMVPDRHSEPEVEVVGGCPAISFLTVITGRSAAAGY
jgi:hypothetical protein